MKRSKVHLPPIEKSSAYKTLNQSEDWGILNLQIKKVWKQTKGEGITIGVIDTGVPDHIDLGDNVIPGENFTTAKDNMDYHGHQTHCVGIICAKDNDVGMVGVAPESKCLCVKGLNDKGSGSWTGLCNALEYCLKNKVDIVSMSLGGSSPLAKMKSIIQKLVDANIPVICAAGNSGSGGVNYPGGYDNTIAIAAYDSSGKIAYFSSKGPEVDFAKPGVGIMSTYIGNKYMKMSGTSMATPYMAGVVALLLSKWKKAGVEYDVQDVLNVLMLTSRDRGDKGKDEDWGNGVIDVPLLLSTLPGDKPAPTPLPTQPKPTKKPKPTPTATKKPKPTPTATKKPTPTPTATKKPKPTPAPVKDEPSWFKKHLAWIIFTGFVFISGVFFTLSKCTEDTIPTPPYIDEQGNVNWDKKLEYDTR